MNRKTLERDFLSASSVPWKTLVVEAHPHGAEPFAFLSDVFADGDVSRTDDVHLHTVDLGEEARFVVDDLNDRFWSFHTPSPTHAATRALRQHVSTRHDLDQVWLPTEHVRRVGPGTRPTFLKMDFHGWESRSEDEIKDLSLTARGTNADRLLDTIKSEGYEHVVAADRVVVRAEDADLGSVEEAVNRFAHFVARGNSFPLHQRVVAQVVARYRAFVEAIEVRAISFESFSEDGGGRMHGAPIEIQLSRPLESVSSVLALLLSSREPFRLWGVPVTSVEYGECEAVDLHVGQRIRLEVSRETLRIHLYAGGCGNTVARLVANLQHHIDGALAFADPELDGHLRLHQPEPVTP